MEREEEYTVRMRVPDGSTSGTTVEMSVFALTRQEAHSKAFALLASSYVTYCATKVTKSDG